MSVYDEDLDLMGYDLNENVEENNEQLFADDNENNAGGTDEKSKTIVEPKNRLLRNPRPRLNIDILTGKRGIHTIEDYFKSIKFGGKGREKQDLDEILKRLQHWAHRMYPAYKFDDVLTNIERLGKKKTLQHHMARYRQGTLNTDTEKDIIEEEINHQQDNDESNEPFDEFDALINEQIAISKLPLLPETPNMNKKANTSILSSVIDTPRFIGNFGETSTPYSKTIRDENEDGIIPLDKNDINEVNFHTQEHTEMSMEQLAQEHSQIPKSPPAKTTDIPQIFKNRPDLTAEQLAKIAENRRLAQEKLKAKKAAMNIQ